MNPIEKIAEREFGSNEIMLGFEKGNLNQVAGTTKVADWNKHFKKVRKALDNE